MVVEVMSKRMRLVRLCLWRNLIFFPLLLTSACNQKKSAGTTLLWRNDQAIGISIARDKGISNVQLHQFVVRLMTNGERTAMLGNFKITDDAIIFEPVIPFTPGLSYEVLLHNHVIGKVRIPEPKSSDAPALISIYPTQDTLPENLLKIYLHFTKPMREGQSIQYIHLLKNNVDTLRNVFLDLQSELWNSDRTMLTVWFDPGRIKRDLHPNLLLGNPLRRNTQYTLVISDRWKDLHGATLSTSYGKKFLVTSRDSLSPNPHAWVISSPKPDTFNSLDIDFRESLDFSLLNTALHVVDENERLLVGAWTFTNEEKKARFIPTKPWATGRYFVQVETRLEDLAGNNINRTFEIDLKHKTKASSSANIVSVAFSINK